MSAITSPAIGCASSMKFSFEIATEPTIHVAVAITIVVLSLTTLAMISIVLGNSTIIIYCMTALTLILWLVLVIYSLVPHTAMAPTATALPPPPLSTAKSKAT
jgi:hypothetical protein